MLLLAAFFGITIGNLLMLQPLLIAEAFGVRDYARIYSRSQFVSTLGVAFGPLLLGVVHDAVDGYSFPYTLAAMMSVGRRRAPLCRWPDGDRGRAGRSHLGQLARRVGHDVAPPGAASIGRRPRGNVTPSRSPSTSGSGFSRMPSRLRRTSWVQWP